MNNSNEVNKKDWRIDRRKNSLKILDAKYNVVASLYSEGNAEENAQLICKAVNEYDNLIEQISELKGSLIDLLFSHYKLSGGLNSTAEEKKAEEIINKISPAGF